MVQKPPRLPEKDFKFHYFLPDFQNLKLTGAAAAIRASHLHPERHCTFTPLFNEQRTGGGENLMFRMLHFGTWERLDFNKKSQKL